MILATRFSYFWKSWEKNVLSLKNGLTTSYLMSYLVTIEMDDDQKIKLDSKYVRGMNE